MFSPDGQQLAYHRFENSEWNIYLINIDGSGKTLLGPGMQPAFSPDGRRLAFVNIDGMWTMGRDGSDVQQVLNANVLDLTAIHPSFSPDGTRLFFYQSNRSTWDETDGSDVYEICRINRDGSGFTRLTQEQGIQFKPGCSPDGAAVVYTQYGSGDEAEIWVMGADGGNKHKIGDGWTASWGYIAQ